jgi:hypothetical protein
VYVAKSDAENLLSQKSELYHVGFFCEIEACLAIRGVKSEKALGLSYWRWQLFDGAMSFYVKRSASGRSSTIYLDARLIELKYLLSRLKNVMPPADGMTTNYRFEVFQFKRRLVVVKETVEPSTRLGNLDL